MNHLGVPSYGRRPGPDMDAETRRPMTPVAFTFDKPQYVCNKSASVH
jgi:hypothetical protein